MQAKLLLDPFLSFPVCRADRALSFLPLAAAVLLLLLRGRAAHVRVCARVCVLCAVSVWRLVALPLAPCWVTSFCCCRCAPPGREVVRVSRLHGLCWRLVWGSSLRSVAVGGWLRQWGVQLVGVAVLVVSGGFASLSLSLCLSLSSCSSRQNGKGRTPPLHGSVGPSD